MLPSKRHARQGGGHAQIHHRRSEPTWWRHLDDVLVKLTQLRLHNPAVFNAAVSFLAMGLIFVFFSAIGARLPPPSHDNLGPDVAGAVDLMSEARYNPYAKNRKQNRLAIIIPYLPSDEAPALPSYFELFAMSAAGSASDVDYLIFHCFIPPSLLPNPDDLPSNVKLIDLNGADDEGKHACGLAKLFTRVTDERQKSNLMKTPLNQLIPLISRQIIKFPYILVEYKPAFGHIFADYLKDYSHWGYSDLDIVFGDVSRWIDYDEWNNFDIVTYGFGDQDRLYLRGQFTFHRNDPEHINQIWRHCKYLSEMDIRYARPDKVKFESAEGCYSQAVLTRKDIRVKWAVKAFTDVGEDSPIYTQGMYLSLGSQPSVTSSRSYRPQSVLYTAATIESGKELLSLPTDWFEDKKKYPKYSEEIPIQKYVGERSKVQTYRSLHEKGDKRAADVKCMYWAPKTYQMDICTTGGVGHDDVVVLEKGELYKQKFVERKKLFPEGIRSFPFFHFQEWKRVYRTTELLPSHNIRRTTSMAGLIITKEGALPLFSHSSASSGWKFHNGGPWSSFLSSSSWAHADTGSSSSHLSSTRFCLKSSPKGYPKGATSCAAAALWPRPGVDYSSTLLDDSTSVAIVRSPADIKSKMKTTMRGRRANSEMSWWDEKLIDVSIDVTLALTLQITTSHMRDRSVVRSLLALADSNIYAWGERQPSILLIHVESSPDAKANPAFVEAIDAIKDLFGPSEVTQVAHLRNSLVAVVGSDKTALSRKSLSNMAASAAPTRWLVSGLELERGLLLSREASLYAARQAKVYSDLPGHVFVMPQFASTREVTRDEEARSGVPGGRLIFTGIGANLLPSIRGKQTMISDLSQYDCVKCAGEISSEDPADDGGGDDAGDDGEGEVDDAAWSNRRRLTDAISSSSNKNTEELLEDMWWDLSVADVYGTPGGFSTATSSSLDAMAKAHDRIEVSLVSLLDGEGEHKEYLQYFDKSPVLMIDRLGPRKEMMTLDLAPEAEDLRGRTCFRLLRLAQLAALGYKVSVLPGAFAASFPETRASLCTEPIQSDDTQECDCELESEGTVEEILINEAKRPGKMAVFMKEQAL